MREPNALRSTPGATARAAIAGHSVFDRNQFPWLPRLESATPDDSRRIDDAARRGNARICAVYRVSARHAGQSMAELNHSRLWSSLWLWRDGVRQEEAIARCPQTAAVLENLPLADQPGFAPTVVFSALAPCTRIPPHNGSTNARLLVHLPLVLPGPAGFRVGNETRPWRMGEAWVFDDTIEHEAWNDADETRVILILDIWNPLLSIAERELICAMMIARSAWYHALLVRHFVLLAQSIPRVPVVRAPVQGRTRCAATRRSNACRSVCAPASRSRSSQVVVVRGTPAPMLAKASRTIRERVAPGLRIAYELLIRDVEDSTRQHAMPMVHVRPVADVVVREFLQIV